MVMVFLCLRMVIALRDNLKMVALRDMVFYMILEEKSEKVDYGRMVESYRELHESQNHY